MTAQEVAGAAPGRDHGHIALTYVTACYFNASDSAPLDALLRHYAGYAPDLLDRIQFIAVDDGSPNPAEVAPDLDLNLMLLRIGVDIAWNQPGARNLGAVLARSDKLLLTDLDCLFPEATLRALVERGNPGATFYKFRRRRMDGTPIGPHPNSFFCSRARFLRFHGYDEEFCGHYGFDDTMFWRWQRYNGTRFRYLPARFPLLLRDSGAAKGFHTLTRDLSHNEAVAARKRRAMREHGAAGGHSRAFLRFPWRVVLDRARSTPVPPAAPNRLWALSWWWRQIVPPR
jgi:hypothetical protein